MKDLIRKILDNYTMGLVFQETAINQILKVTGNGENLNATQIGKVNKMLIQNSKDSWIAAKGTINGWKEWHTERCKLNVNTTKKN